MIKKIPEAELKVMKFIWKMNKTVSSKEVIIAMDEQFNWKQTTTLTLLARLIKKEFLSAEKLGRFTHYTIIVGEEEYKNFETRNFFGIIHNDSKESLMASLYADNILSEEILESFNEDFNKTKDDE
ncbi:BlaI/MecI/CopY family transcriptional regulator [Clostridioides sp. ZZV15-6597]|uniref:BlaI/MecI/CopY family transcriptional regulator n=1 Tax=Clostridioides sp. ZZV15-6597 TaxID=2811500 RepID=UPI001D102A06|nr:BlaI/MecI/CopY family transcriptional regulator [Clostridioides sp. ZZV15-6597]